MCIRRLCDSKFAILPWALAFEALPGHSLWLDEEVQRLSRSNLDSVLGSGYVYLVDLVRLFTAVEGRGRSYSKRRGR